MKVFSEISLRNFKPWSGAVDTFNALSYEDLDRLEDVLNEMYPDGVEETTINDLLWFDGAWVAETLGYRNEEAMLNSDKDTYEEHCREVIEKNFPYAEEDDIDNYIFTDWDDKCDDDNTIIEEFGKFLKQCKHDEAEEHCREILEQEFPVSQEAIDEFIESEWYDEMTDDQAKDAFSGFYQEWVENNELDEED